MRQSSTLSRRKLFSLSGAVAGSAGINALCQDEKQKEDGVSPANPDSPQSTGVLYNAASGPWGNLQYYYFYLEAPQYLIESFPVTNPRTRWAVPIGEEQIFRALLDKVFMSAEARAALSDPANSGSADGIFAVFPPPFVITSLSSDSRAKLYFYLERFEINPEIRDPIRIFSGSVDEWVSGTDLRPEIIKLMKGMTYERNGLLMFADVSFLISQATSEAEARTFQMHSSRVRTMVLRLNLKKLGPIESLMEYWTTGLGLRRKQIEPLIQSGIDTPGISGLDIVHLLPPLARKLLYTYPDLSMAMEGQLPDCHWTALNFFNYSPEPLYLEEFFAASGLLSDFDTVDADYKFGDILVFVTAEMNAFHSCVYIAADIVYTKNGRSLYQPWTLHHLRDIKKLYAETEGKPLRVQGFRKKKPAPGAV